MRAPTPGQTVGPFFGMALPYDGDSELVPIGHPQAIRLHGTVADGDGAGVPDALIEIWQLDADGQVVRQPGSLHRDGYTFTGFGRAATDATGHYTFTTVSPGGDDPHFAIAVFARGLLDRLFTRCYLPGTSAKFVQNLPDDRRSTVVAEADGDRSLRFDIVLQGDGETVFLDFAS